MNETAIKLADYYDRFSLNMMHTYNKTKANLVRHMEADEIYEEDGEEIRERAFNLTLIENSKSFLKMLTFNSSSSSSDNKKSIFNLTEEINNLKQFLKSKNIDKHVIYKQFVSQFSNKFDEKILDSDAKKSFKNSKTYKRFLANLARFKQR